ncbi:MAG: hypothetical protein ACTSWR_11165 [Candidatus Helarchaeota archaeon]
MTNETLDKIIADIVINIITELQKITPLDINEIDRFMTYQFKTNKSIKNYKEELIQNIELLNKSTQEKKQIKKIFLEYLDDLELLHNMNHIILSMKLQEILTDKETINLIDFSKFRKMIEFNINQKKDIIKYYLSILTRKYENFYI